MKVEMVMPQMGESLAEGTIVKWLKKEGEKVERDETILEISTDKVDSEIPAPAGGVLEKILVPEGETVNVGTVIAILETEEAEAQVGTAAPPPTPEKEPVAEPVAEQTPEPVDTSAAASYQAESVAVGEIPRTSRDGKRFFSPLVRNIAKVEGIAIEELERIPGSGLGGRVTKRDVLAFLRERKERPAVEVAPPPRPAYAPTAAPTYADERVEIIPMDHMRKAIAEHMVRSVHTSPHVYSVSEADMTRIARFRDKHKAAFQQREGFKLTFTPFIVDAVVKAIRDYPLINSSVEEDRIVRKKYINIGVAVALENGLIVPVVKNADEKNLVGLARAIQDLATRARTKKLMPDEVQDGTFSVTNPGVFGNLYGLPIINQPQVAILGVGAIKKRPVIINDAIAIRDMVYLTLSYDHRIIDGAYGGLFLERIVYYLENFDIEQTL
jgi:2-oxoglutarate dehydrogenase E2 component (dihydrolipoamide succinyltransferase)